MTAVQRPENTAELDIAAALERMGNDLGMLHRVLQSFSRELPGVAQQLEMLIQADAFQDACRLMHTLKGTAATMGAHRLSTVAADAERRLCAEPPPDAKESGQLVAGVRSAAAAVSVDVQQLLQALRPEEAPGADAPAALNSAQLRGDLVTLLNLLRSSDMNSLEVFEMLRQQHGPALASELEPLAEAMAELNFERAMSLCEAMQARYTA